MLPSILPITQDSLKSLSDDERKVVLTILEDEVDEKSKELIKVLKSAASANRDLVFGYVGLKQWEDFVESFEVYKKTPLPKMVVWDGDEEYFTVSDCFYFLKGFLTTFIAHYFEGVQLSLSSCIFEDIAKNSVTLFYHLGFSYGLNSKESS